YSFYSQYSDDVMNKCVEDHQESTGMIWDIIRAKNSNIESPTAQIEILDDILTNNSSFADEDIIQFVELAVLTYGKWQWLKEHLPELEEKAIYPEVLLYETAMAAELSGDNEYAIELLERLTDLQPFNPDFWIVLCKEYILADQHENGLSALEYAIAIDPNNPETLHQKAKLLFTMERDHQEILDWLIEIDALDGMNREMLKLAGLIHRMRGDEQQAIDTYKKYLQAHPEDSTGVLMDLASLVVDDNDEILSRIHSIDDDVDDWYAWAQELVSTGDRLTAISVIDKYCRATKIFNPPLGMVELAFRLGMFEHTELLLGYYLTHGTRDMSEDPEELSRALHEVSEIEFFYIFMITKFKLGKTHDVKVMASMFLENDQLFDFPDLTHSLTVTGFLREWEIIYNLLDESDGNYSWEKYDPFGYWSNGDDIPTLK
ncbi:MAG: tetratricopeptide repeat protein, partial [Muribaculaceae bacterium]|nr:tetratricopeptide repeat protein [Muribaculaceae bacterium]